MPVGARFSHTSSFGLEFWWPVQKISGSPMSPSRNAQAIGGALRGTLPTPVPEGEDSWRRRPSPLSHMRVLRARQEIRCTFCCWPPGPLARRERRAYPLPYVRSEQHSQRACGPQPGGARRRAGICGVAAPRRCHHIACVAAPCICPPGARAKMHTLFPDGPLPRVGHPRQFLPTVVDFFNGTHNVVHIVLPPQQQPVLQPHRFAAGVLRVGTEVRKGCVIDLARVVVTGGRTAARIDILI